MKSNNYYHGSSSASLVGVLNGEPAGLKSFGQLSEEGKVPYCYASLDLGKSKRGINRKCISAVPPESIKDSVDYALRYSKESWTPDIGRRNLRWLADEISRFESRQNLMEYQHVVLDLLRLEKRVQELRIGNWSILSASERELITNPFAIIYGFDYDGQVIPANSDYHKEVGIPEIIPLEKLTIYAPNDKLRLTDNFRLTTSLSTRIDKNPLVLPFDELKHLQSLPQDAYDSIDQLINQTR